MTLVPNEAEQALNRQYDIYAAAREEYRKKIAEQAEEIERLTVALREDRHARALASEGRVDELRRENEKLRAALRMLYDEMDEYQRINNLSAYNNQVMRQARAALEEK